MIENNHQLRLYTQQKYFSEMRQLKYFQKNKKLGVYYQKSLMDKFKAIFQIGKKMIPERKPRR